MLVLTRKEGEILLIGDDIEISVVRVEGDQVRLGINAPRRIRVIRGELLKEIHNETVAAANTPNLSSGDIAKLAEHIRQQTAARKEKR